MGARIFLNRFNPEQIASNLLLDKLRNILIIPQHLSVHYYAAGTGNRVYAVCFRNGKVSNQDAGLSDTADSLEPVSAADDWEELVLSLSEELPEFVETFPAL